MAASHIGLEWLGDGQKSCSTACFLESVKVRKEESMRHDLPVHDDTAVECPSAEFTFEGGEAVGRVNRMETKLKSGPDS